MLAVVIYGALVVDTVGCLPAPPGEVALSMLWVGIPAGFVAGLMAWQGGRLVSRLRGLGIVIAFPAGVGLLVLVIGAAVFRALFGWGCGAPY